MGTPSIPSYNDSEHIMARSIKHDPVADKKFLLISLNIYLELVKLCCNFKKKNSTMDSINEQE